MHSCCMGVHVVAGVPDQAEQSAALSLLLGLDASCNTNAGAGASALQPMSNVGVMDLLETLAGYQGAVVRRFEPPGGA